MSEVVQVQVGQAGNRIGASYFKLLCEDHGLDSTGSLCSPERSYCIHKCFQETSKQTFQPRSLLIDLEPSALDQVRSSGPLYSPDQYLFDQAGSGNVYAKGFYGEGVELAQMAAERVRKQVEACDCLLGFQLVHSIGGGTGSGLGSRLITSLREEYFDRVMCSYSVIPSTVTSDVVIEPYNAVLAFESLLENLDLAMIFDNEALHQLVCSKQGKESPTYREINQCIAAAMSGITSSFRFPGILNSNYRKIAVNLVPIPRLHFLTVSHAPLSPSQPLTVPSIVQTLFTPSNFMVTGDVSDSRSITNFASFRGNLSSSEVEESLSSHPSTHHPPSAFWLPTPLCTSLTARSAPLSGTLLLNHGVIREVCRRILKQFHVLFARKAFVHWYTSEGMELMEFTEASSNLEDVCADYGYGNYCGEEEEEFEEEEGI